jgi:hypothetical protein
MMTEVLFINKFYQKLDNSGQAATEICKRPFSACHPAPGRQDRNLQTKMTCLQTAGRSIPFYRLF